MKLMRLWIDDGSGIRGNPLLTLLDRNFCIRTSTTTDWVAAVIRISIYQDDDRTEGGQRVNELRIDDQVRIGEVRIAGE